MKSQQSINQFKTNLQNSLKSKGVSADDDVNFERNLRSSYDECKDCNMKKELNHVCLSKKCDGYFKLVCPYCHKLNHKIDVTLTYQLQDIDSFMQEIAKMAKLRSSQSKQLVEKNKLFQIIDDRIKDFDNIISSVEMIKNVLQFKKMAVSQAFKDYDIVYEEMKKIYRNCNQFSNLNKTLDNLHTKFHYKKGSNGMWQLVWKNENYVQEQFYKPLFELTMQQQQIEQSVLQQNSKRGQITEITEQEEDNSSNGTIVNEQSKTKPEEKFNQAIEEIENTLKSLQATTSTLLHSPEFAFLYEAGTLDEQIKEEKTKCVNECNQILKENDIHYQWETFDQMIDNKEASTPISSIVIRFCSIFLTRAYHEEDGDEIPKPNLEKLFSVYLQAKEKIEKFEQYKLKNFSIGKKR